MSLSKSRLERMQQVLSGYVERQELPELVTLVSHNNDMRVETFGTLSSDDPAPMRRDEIFHVSGRFGWEGGFGTSARIDPANNMIGILFSQCMMDSPQAPKLYNDFWTLAYAAME